MADSITRSYMKLPAALLQISLLLLSSMLPCTVVLMVAAGEVVYTDTNSQLTSLPVNSIPKTVTVLRLSNNRLNTLRDNQFGLFPKLQEVDLHRNSLYLIEPLTFNGTVVEVLNLSENAFTSVPDLGCLGNTLSSLDLSYNLIIALNPSFYQMTNLMSLNLAGNSIAHVWDEVFCGTILADLDLSNNLLTSVPILWCLAQDLKVLKLNYNLIEEIAREDFVGLTSLTKLWIRANDIQSLDKDSLQKLPSLELISLSLNPLRFTHPLAFSYSPLQEILLANTELSTYPNLTSLNTTISVVSLYPLRVGLTDLSLLQGAFLPRLKTLSLAVGQNATMPTVNAPELISLELQCMATCDSPFDNFTHQMALLQKIESIILINTSFTEIPDFSSDLPHPFKLHTLVLTDGHLTEVNKNALANLGNLTTLHLSRNNLTRISSQAFLWVGYTLQDLDLSDNPSLGDIDPEVYLMLQSLQTLSLNNTGLTTFPTLSSNMSIKDLSVNYNPRLLNLSSTHFLPLHSLTELGLAGSLDRVQAVPDLTYLLTNHSLTSLQLSTFLCTCSNVWIFDLIAQGHSSVTADIYPCLGDNEFLNKTVTGIRRSDFCPAEYQIHTDTNRTKCAVLCALHGNRCPGFKHHHTTCHLEISPGIQVTMETSEIFCVYDMQGSKDMKNEFSVYTCTQTIL